MGNKKRVHSTRHCHMKQTKQEEEQIRIDAKAKLVYVCIQFKN